MPPTDAHTDSGPGPAPGPGGGAEDTLDLRLPDDFLALFHDNDHALLPESARARPWSTTGGATAKDLLGDLAEWGPAATPAGAFRLVPVALERDLALIVRWMNDPAVAAFWELAGPDSVTATHLRAQLEGDGRSVPCLGVLDDTPMSYFEIYRADLDPLARHYPARPHDTGVHLLIGGVADRGRGVGSTILRAVSGLVLDNLPLCTRVIAEPDLRNTPSVSAFLSSGFRLSEEIDLPDKRAALMVRDRALRNLL
ncbi:GNAT family N-acetyltransferase [Streptomyces peucetius]|uniref:Lysine N-acyltransferase MbtK n=1 Tax=Streptomyces peucetius TaxID=1950 RepID=A0ABY6ICY6_STRPE|nr:GNAT family N-acetyltransferase [Streptomyces peucetius]UYQ64868.1 acetyltransferase [Streptomyces peucetius]